MMTDLLPPVATARDFAIWIGQQLGITARQTSGYRDLTKQAALRATYETCLAKYGRVGLDLPADCHYPANRPGDSAHNFGLAWDSWVPDDQWDDWTAIRRAVGFSVGGANGDDRVHAEVPNWRALVPELEAIGLFATPQGMNNVPQPPLTTFTVATSSVPAVPLSAIDGLPGPAMAVEGSFLCANAKLRNPGYRVYCNGKLMT